MKLKWKTKMMIGALFVAAALGLSFRTSAVSFVFSGAEVPVSQSSELNSAFKTALDENKKIEWQSSSLEPGKSYHLKVTKLEDRFLLKFEEDK